MSVETVTYKPAPGSIAWRVLDFLLKNPDEELTRGDIAIKFETAPVMVDAQLMQACDFGVLKRARSTGTDSVVWALGKNSKHVELLPWGGQEPVEPAPVYLVPAGRVGIAMPIIRKATPLMDDAARRRLAFLEWLGQFDVGDSAEFAEADLHEIRRQATELRRTHPRRRFRYVALRDGVYGIERVTDAPKARQKTQSRKAVPA